MFKGYEFNKVCRMIKRGSAYQQEFDLLHELLGSDNKNIRFEYTTVAEAKNASQALRKYVKEIRQPLSIKQRNNFVFAVRKEDE